MRCWRMRNRRARRSMGRRVAEPAHEGRVGARALAEEMTDHLGYEQGDPNGHGSGNSRNGHSEKTVSTTAGLVRVQVPRDHNSDFEPQIVPKRKRIGQIDEMVLSLYSRGMTTRDIQDTSPRSMASPRRRRRSRRSPMWWSMRSRCGRTAGGRGVPDPHRLLRPRRIRGERA
jgi:Transposase, Mutator family